ncbi:MAG: hypothetical protein IRZ07_12275 [Microbispora sp.]|nr:hypothetical protein [Microbispora sp.]
MTAKRTSVRPLAPATSYADQWGFAPVLPQTPTADNASSCFNWFQPGDTTRGQGEAASIRAMVAYAVAGFGTGE